MFDEGLSRRVARGFKQLSPLYEFYLKAEITVHEAEREGSGND